MKKLFILLLFVSMKTLCFGQGVSSEQLSTSKIEAIFTDELKAKLKIDFDIFRVYQYQDASGEHLIVMTERPNKNVEKSYDAIKAFNFKVVNGEYTLEWSFRDFILPPTRAVGETSITFWTKYFVLDDYDEDGLIDPIFVYGTLALNGRDDGRIKILVYHKGLKRAIRHQNGVLDYDRHTQVDKKYYSLPTKIQARVKEIMDEITSNDHGIFPFDWEMKMKNKELTFDERN